MVDLAVLDIVQDRDTGWMREGVREVVYTVRSTDVPCTGLGAGHIHILREDEVVERIE